MSYSIQLLGFILLSSDPGVIFAEILRSNSGMAFVKECPKNLTEVQEASKRLNCGIDRYGNDRYLCLPNTRKTSLVEFCYNGTMGMHPKGYCLEASNGRLHLEDCKHFAFGCPEMYFRSTAFYEYPACQTIDIKRQCYMLDTSCSSREIKYVELSCSSVVWQLLFLLFLFFSISLLVIVLRNIRKKLKGKRTYVKRTAKALHKTCDIYTVDQSGNGFQDSSTKSKTNYTFPLYRDGKCVRGGIFGSIFVRKKSKDCLSSEFPGQYLLHKEDSCTDLLPAEKDVIY